MGTPPDVGLGLPPIGANPTAEDLIAHAESLTAQLQYYMPSLEGMPDILKPGGLLAGASGAADLASVTQAVYALGELRGPLDESEEQTEYADMLAQPGNTKKRKVPLNMAGFPVAQDHRGGDDSLEEERDRERLLEGRDPKGWPGADGATDGGSGGMRTLKNLSRVTLASLRHKELLRNRKEQLAGVITSGSHADTLALDQALASNYPFSKPATGQPRVRLSRRNRLRVMRTGHEHRRTLPTRTLATPVTVPKDDFTFECESASE